MEKESFYSCRIGEGKAHVEDGEAVSKTLCFGWIESPSRKMHVKQAMRSMHPGGVYVTLGDASVKFISDYVDVSVGDCSRFSIWDRLNLSNDGMVLDHSKY